MSTKKLEIEIQIKNDLAQSSQTFHDFVNYIPFGIFVE